MPTLSLPEDAARDSTLRRFLRRGAKSAALGVLIAVVLTLGAERPFADALAYAVPITAACWFLIDGGRALAARWTPAPAGAGGPRHWPGWPWMGAVIVLGSVLGYSAGNAVGNLLTGGSSPGLFVDRPMRALGLLLVVLLPGLATTYYFYSRERLAAEQERTQRAQREATESQLRLLQAQLEPHMLFNTLANLRVLIMLDPPRAQAMLDRLIAFLRATLDASRAGRHALSAEFARLADYLALMQVRMGERLQVRLDLPDELAALPVPPLLLQPLVENSIQHGLEPRVEGGRVEIRAAREGAHLLLHVRDTGLGLDTAPHAGSHFGLQQVRERLATLYGGRASLELCPARDAEGGTLATVRLPIEP